MINEINRYGICQISEPITEDELIQIACNKNIRVITVSGLLGSKSLVKSSWESLNDIVFLKRNDIGLDICDFYTSECDLGFTSFMTNVERFSVGSLNYGIGYENISQMKNLKTLRMTVPDLENYEFLENLSNKIEKLIITSSSKHKINLSFLSKMKSIKVLEIGDGTFKNVEAISELENIEELTLKYISTPDIRYISNMRKLWSLRVIVSGIKDFSALQGMHNLKYLELYQIRNLSDISFILELDGLQFLNIESISKITNLPNFVNTRGLRRVVMNNLKCINDYSNLTGSEFLEEVYLGKVNHLEPENLLILADIPKIKEVFASFCSNKKDETFKRMMRERGISVMEKYQNFKFY